MFTSGGTTSSDDVALLFSCFASRSDLLLQNCIDVVLVKRGRKFVKKIFLKSSPLGVSTSASAGFSVSRIN